MATQEVTNTVAMADLQIGEDHFHLPATVLLGLENQLKNLRLLYQAVPTLKPTERWLPDTEKTFEKALFRTSEKISVKNVKEKAFQIVVQPTEHFPAEIREVTKDKEVGEWRTQEFSGEVSSVQKSEWLSKIDELMRIVKRARTRANSTEILPQHLGSKISSFIMKG